MKITDLLNEIRSAKLYIEVIGDQLKLDVLENKPSDELLTKIRQHKAELISFLKKQNIIEILPVEKSEYYPASSEQKRLFALQELDKQSTVYNLLLSYMLKGKLNIEQIKKTFRQLIERHESFRTELVLDNGVLFQKVNDEVEFNIDYCRNNEQSFEQFLNHFSRPFDLSKAPLLRVGLYMKTELEHIMLIDMHHCISDGVSMAIVMKDFRMLYDELELPIQTIHYKDYAVWKQKKTSEDILKDDKEFWLNQLEGEIPILNLPTDYQRPAIIDYKGDTEEFALDHDTTIDIHRICKENRITLYSFLFSAFKVLLSKYSRQEDIVVGTINAGRDRDELKGIVGMFANTLAIRSNPLDSKRFIDFANELKDICFDAFAHQHFPFEELVGELNVERDLGRNPLFDVLFVLQNMEVEKFAVGNLEVDFFPMDQKYSKFDISLSAQERDNKITFHFEYSTNLFSRETIQRMGSQFCYILKTLSKNIDLLIKDIDLTPQETRLDQIKLFNKNTYSYPQDKTVVHLLEEQAEKTPHHVAVVFENNSLTYSELIQNVDHFASFLLSEGIQKGDIVGLVASRSSELIAAIFGILKVSASYLPVDPSYPQDRIEYVLRDSNVKYILFDTTFEMKGSMHTKKASFNEVLSSTINVHQVSNDLPKPSDLAYIIYTSGSTGNPKGVMVNHYSLTNVLFALNRLYPCLEDDSFLFKTSFCFDVSLSEIFGWLFNGGKLVILENGSEAIPAEIEKTIAKHKVTHINFVPSMFNAILDSIDKNDIGKYDSVKYFMIAGEAFTPELAEKFNALGLAANLENIYGPTEATIYASYYSLKNWNPKTRIPIGKPIDNTQLYVLDDNLKLQTVGILGELYIGGAALARGYINCQELSAEKFISNPYSPNQLLYKTGDLVRWLPCGNIEYFGRIDSQVKVRGYRIDLGEIENAFNSQDAVSESVVVVNEIKGDKYICAYLVLKHEIDVLKIKTSVAGILPSYMLPDFLIQIDIIPLLINGKIDKKALPDPSVKSQQLDIDYRAPSNSTEKELVKIWSENLGINEESISTNSSYFEMGGNSIKLISLLSKINKEFNTDVNLKDLYINKNIKSLSDLISASDQHTENRYPQISHVSEDLHKPFPLSNIQFSYLVGRNSYLELGNVSTHSFWRLDAEADLDKVNTCLNLLIDRHHALRTIVTEQGEQVILGKKTYKISIQDVRTFSKSEQDKISTEIAKRMSHQIFDASKWPLFEISAIQVGHSNYIFFISLDTIVADAYSIELIKDEFKTLYKNANASFDRLTITFRDYIVALNELKESPFYAKDRDFWLNKLSDFPSAPSLPLERNLSEVEKPNFKAIRKTFSVYESNLIKDFSKRGNVSLSTLLLTVYAEVLSYWSNQADLGLNLTFFNRLPFHESINDIVGDFTSLILLDVRLKQGQLFNERITSVQETLLEALDHRLYDGVEFIREISKQRNLAKKAVMPVVFTSALFDASLNFAEIENNTFSFERDRIHIDRGTPTSQVYLDNVVGEQNGRIFLIWNYIEELFSVEDINNMFDMYVAKIYDLIAETTKYTEELNQPVHKLYESYNDTNTEDLQRETTIHELISKQCKLTPDLIAVSLHSQKLTYAELDEQSNKVANYLAEKGVQKADSVCILGERKIETIINILGVLKLGAVYVPLNPENPVNRNNKIQRNCNAQFLLDPQTFQSKIDEFYSNEFELVKVNPDDTAYIIFTSGSTGTPKGVVISHTSAVNTILDINERFNVGVNDRILQISSFSFDLSIYDIFGSLISGAQLVMLNTNKSVEEIVQTLIEDKITIFNAVPSFWKLVVENLPMGQILSHLRHVLLSGDWIPINLARQTIEQFPNLLLTSLGGATEGSIWSIYYPVEKINPDWKSIPYGYPLRNQQFYILNFENEICPVGVKGMLYIGGVGVTKGYLNDQDQTHKSLLNHTTYGLLYKTGDYGVMHPEGYIEFLGREDDQVKIKGHRIELGEIEKNLNSIAQVKDSLVTIYRDDKRDAIIAYIIEQMAEKSYEKGVLTNSVQRLEFKLAQHGIRQFSGHIREINLTKNLTYKVVLDFSQPRSGKVRLTNSIKFDHLELLLESLRQFDVKDSFQFPKYLYPSAGSLYPVQVYLYISENSLTDLDSGYYYYNPKAHSVVSINSDTSKSNTETDQILLVGKIDAIQPIYGSAAKSFCLLEAGHIAGLLKDVSRINNISLSKVHCDKDVLGQLDLYQGYFLASHYSLGYANDQTQGKSKAINEISIFSRQSYRNFIASEIQLEEFAACLEKCIKFNSDCHNIAVYVYLKEGIINGIEEGFYAYDREVLELQKTSDKKLIERLYDGQNRDIYKGAGFAIFLVAKRIIDNKDKSSSLDFDKEDVFDEAGRIGQSINTFFPLSNLGVCAIGYVNTDLIRDAMNLKPDDEVIYSFLGGKISAEQTQYRDSDQTPKRSSSLLEDVRRSLEKNLPEYMIPNYILPIEKFPLTQNKKINRKLLPLPDFGSNNEFVMPKGTTEIELCELMSPLLNTTEIGATDDFFELGGDSLKAMALIARINKNFNVNIDLSDFFSRPTIKELGLFIQSIQLISKDEFENTDRYHV
ncbi:amino acid adenylation domain-containing protein [Gaetbulibacter jejuensis]|uniref:Non-ribosomal peptide synthetase n=1 Tax=Gaetbulibacter jejuensis TaxID=584607 RepID=A0ABN1JIA8_9FLAO